MRYERKEKGQSLVEMALILPVLLIILAGVLDLGRLYYAYVIITDAAAEGVAYAASNPPADPGDLNDPDTAEIYARVQDTGGGLVQGPGSVEIVCPTCPGVASGDPITVTVSYDFPVMTPFFNILASDGVLPLNAVATGVILTGEY
jgi:Flp pilus assembly protein TadG